MILCNFQSRWQRVRSKQAVKRKQKLAFHVDSQSPMNTIALLTKESTCCWNSIPLTFPAALPQSVGGMLTILESKKHWKGKHDTRQKGWLTRKRFFFTKIWGVLDGWAQSAEIHDLWISPGWPDCFVWQNTWIFRLQDNSRCDFLWFYQGFQHCQPQYSYIQVFGYYRVDGWANKL